MAAKYYIYAGGRWCEVETQRGRVEGFRTRARFCFLKGGKLQLARSAAVLRGLRTLTGASGAPRGAVRDAAPLPQRQRRHRRRSRRDAHTHARNHCCAHHDRCDVNANELRDKPVPLITLTAPAALATQPLLTSPRKRKRIISSEEEQILDKSPAKVARKLLQKFLKQCHNNAVARNEKESERHAQRRLTRSRAVKVKNDSIVLNSESSHEKSPLKHNQVSPQKSRKNDNRKETNAIVHSVSSDKERGRSPVNHKHKSSQKSSNTNRNRKETNIIVNSDSSDAEPVKSPAKQRTNAIVHSVSSDKERERSPVRHNQGSPQKSYKNGNRKETVVSCDSSDEIHRTHVRRNQVTSRQSFKNGNKKQTNTILGSDSSDEEPIKSPVKHKQASSQKSSHKIGNRKETNISVLSDSSDREQGRSPVKNNQASSQKSHKNRNGKYTNIIENSDSSDEEQLKSPVKRNQSSSLKSSYKNRNKKETNNVVVSDSSDEKSSHKSRNKKKTNNVVDSDSSDEEHVKSPMKHNQGSSQKSSHKTHSNRKEINTVVNSDSSDDEHVKSPVKHNQTPLQKPSNKNRNRLDRVSNSEDKQQQKQTKKQPQRSETQSFVSKEDTEKLFRSLLDSSSDNDSTRQDSDGSESQAKELLIDDKDVAVLRRFLAKKGIGDLKRFDNDEEYKTRVFYKLNPLVSVTRYKPLENLLRQKMTLNEFARNLGLRSVAEVTPEKRYKMRRSTKQARSTADSETDKENNIVKPKRRKLWNNDKSIFNSVTSRSSEVKPQIEKPILNENSSKETTDSDTEFKRKVRAQLARKSKLRAIAAEKKEELIDNSGVTDKNEQRNTRSTSKVATTKVQENKPDNESKKPANPRLESSEDVRRTRSSDRFRIPAGTLREQNKVSESSDSAFEAKNSPKKPNVEKGKDAVKASAVNRNKEKSQKPQNEDIEVERVEKMKSAVVNSMTTQPVKFKHSSVAYGREYTSLEDQAIVAWVSVGGRERRVNGNAIWRDLQAQYERITGQNRSWHSLRNRYLRYVLPSIGQMALPPAQVSRLRAAAATGTIKTKTASNRRNSIFNAPAVRTASNPGAKTRQPRSQEDTPAKPRREDTPVKTKAPAHPSPPSPSYSAITRRFASRVTRAAATSSPVPAKKKKRRAKNW